MVRHIQQSLRRSWRRVLAVLPVVVGLLVAGLSSPTSAVAADNWVYTSAVVVNNSTVPWDLMDWNATPCAGDFLESPYASWDFVVAPTARIAPGAAGGWTVGGPDWDGAYSYLAMCRDDAQRAYYHLMASYSGTWSSGQCQNDGPVTPPDTCTVETRLKPGTVLFRFGPKVDPQVSVQPSGNSVPGVPVTLTAKLTYGSDAGASSVPRGTMNFDLGANGSGQCAAVAVVGRTATCQATFTGTGPQVVKASYTGDFQFLPGSGSGTVIRSGPLVQAPYYPGSGPGWEAGAPFTDYPFKNVPGTPLAVAVSHDGKAMAAISSSGQVYARVDNPLQNPAPEFTPMYAANGQPMLATSVAIDTNPTTGEVQLAVVGGDKRIWHRTLPPRGTWSAWGSPGPDFFQATDVALSIDNSGTAHVAALGLDHNINYRTRHADGNWDGWQIVRDTAGLPVQATRVALAAATSGPSAGAVELDLIGYGASTFDHRVFTMSKAAGSSSWLPPREVLASSGAPFISLAAGRVQTPVDGASTDVGLVVATTGPNAPVARTLRTNSAWGDRAAATVVRSGWSGLAVSATGDGKGIGFTTWQK